MDARPLPTMAELLTPPQARAEAGWSSSSDPRLRLPACQLLPPGREHCRDPRSPFPGFVSAALEACVTSHSA